MSGTATPIVVTAYGGELVGGVLWNSSEFQDGKTATCGVESLADGYAWAEQKFVDMLTVFNPMHAAGQCDANGAAKTSGVAARARADGFSIVDKDDGSGYAHYEAFFKEQLQYGVIVIEVANGQALHDYLTGAHEDATNLKYHFIMLAGFHAGGHSPVVNKDLPAGYWSSDPDSDLVNPIVDGHRVHQVGTHKLCFYPVDVLTAAVPCGAVAIRSKVAIPGGDEVPSPLTSAQVDKWFTEVSPTEWKSKDTGVSVQDGILGFYKTLPGPGMTYGTLPFPGLPLLPRFYVGDVAILICERAVLIYDPKREYDTPPGTNGPVYFGHINDARILALLTPQQAQQIADAQAKIKQLEAQLAAAPAAPAAPVAPPAPANPPTVVAATPRQLALEQACLALAELVVEVAHEVGTKTPAA